MKNLKSMNWKNIQKKYNIRYSKNKEKYNNQYLKTNNYSTQQINIGKIFKICRILIEF